MPHPPPQHAPIPLRPQGPRYATSHLVLIPPHRVREMLRPFPRLLFLLLFFPTALLLYVLLPLFIPLSSKTLLLLLFPLFFLLFVLFAFCAKPLFTASLFDKKTGFFYRRKTRNLSVGEQRDYARIPLAQIRSLELLEKPHKETASYELNFRHLDGSRHNLLNHGDYHVMLQEAELLSSFLGIPLVQHRV